MIAGRRLTYLVRRMRMAFGEDLWFVKGGVWIG